MTREKVSLSVPEGTPPILDLANEHAFFLETDTQSMLAVVGILTMYDDIYQGEWMESIDTTQYGVLRTVSTLIVHADKLGNHPRFTEAVRDQRPEAYAFLHKAVRIDIARVTDVVDSMGWSGRGVSGYFSEHLNRLVELNGRLEAIRDTVEVDPSLEVGI